MFQYASLFLVHEQLQPYMAHVPVHQPRDVEASRRLQRIRRAAPLRSDGAPRPHLKLADSRELVRDLVGHRLGEVDVARVG